MTPTHEIQLERENAKLRRIILMQGDEWRVLQNTPMLNAANRDRVPADMAPLKFTDKKAGDMSEWPADLRVREFPTVTQKERPSLDALKA